MKMVAYVGSKSSNSQTLVFVKRLIHFLNQEIELEAELIIPGIQDIKECIGCNSCFLTQSCSLEDDMAEVRQKLLTCDIIILATPVYTHAVTGSTKIFIDRIAYWTHTMRLVGKFGISINVSDNNGNHFVDDYLSKVIDFMGVHRVSNISIKTRQLKDATVLDSHAGSHAKNIATALRETHHYGSAFQEVYFEQVQGIAQGRALNPSEANVLLRPSHDITNYNTFHDFFCDAIGERMSR